MTSPYNNCPGAVLQAAQRRVEELKRALQDAYLLTYREGEASELGRVLERAAVPVPGGGAYLYPHDQGVGGGVQEVPRLDHPA